MLINFNEMLSRAYKEKRAVGSFNVYEVWVVERAKRPVPVLQV